MKQLSSIQQEQLIKLLTNKNFYKGNKNDRLSIFLCGGDVNKSHFGRHKMSIALSKSKNVDVFYPEDLFDDLLAGQGQYSLLSLENMLAEAVDVIILFPESPGSYAELGAFSNNEKLREKLICIQDEKYKSKRSFLNYGPIRLMKSLNPNSVIRCNVNDISYPSVSTTFFRKLNKSVSGIIKNTKTDKSIGNLLYADRIILPFIYLLEGVSNVMLYELMGKAIKKDEIISEIIVKSALGRLIASRRIIRTIDGYHVTPLGSEYVRDTFDRNVLDKVRLEIMNFENRSKASFKYDRVKSAHP